MDQVSNQFETAYIYIITRRDLPFEKCTVQCGHAIWEASKAFSHLTVEHPHFCICSVRDEKRLRHDMEKLCRSGVKLREFYEEDLDNQLTAFATEPIYGERRHLFRNFQLLKVSPGKEVLHAVPI